MYLTCTWYTYICLSVWAVTCSRAVFYLKTKQNTHTNRKNTPNWINSLVGIHERGIDSVQISNKFMHLYIIYVQFFCAIVLPLFFWYFSICLLAYFVQLTEFLLFACLGCFLVLSTGFCISPMIHLNAWDARELFSSHILLWVTFSHLLEHTRDSVILNWDAIYRSLESIHWTYLEQLHKLLTVIYHVVVLSKYNLHCIKKM